MKNQNGKGRVVEIAQVRVSGDDSLSDQMKTIKDGLAQLIHQTAWTNKTPVLDIGFFLGLLDFLYRLSLKVEEIENFVKEEEEELPESENVT